MANLRHIASHYLLNKGTIIERPLLTIDSEGRTVQIEQWERLDTLASTEFYAGALCAGMVNAHCHIELSYLRGAIAEGTGFAGFARAIGQVRGNFTAEERQGAIVAADAAMWAEGVEAVGDIVNDASSFEMKRHSRIAYHSFAEVFGLGATTEAARSLLAEQNTSLTPHSTYSVQEAVFREIANEQSDAPLSIHFMESDDEAALYRGEGSLAEWYERMGWRCDFLHYGSPAERIAKSIPKNRRVMLVHNCCISGDDLSLLAERFGGRESWVVCPCSNDYISGLRPPVEMLRREGVRICIGTDSLASNHSLSMIEEMKSLREVPLRELAAWATANGAEALGIADKKGTIEVGRQSGIVLIEGIERKEDGELYLTCRSSARRLV